MFAILRKKNFLLYFKATLAKIEIKLIKSHHKTIGDGLV